MLSFSFTLDGKVERVAWQWSVSKFSVVAVADHGVHSQCVFPQVG